MSDNEPTNYSLSAPDQTELSKLVSFLELSSGATSIFAITPGSEPHHPVIENLKYNLSESEENFEIQNFFYSDNSLHNFLYSLDNTDAKENNHTNFPADCDEQTKRKVLMVFGLEQLPQARLVREMKQLNLGRESISNRELVLIFWLNKDNFLDEFRSRAPDFWDWRGKVFRFTTPPTINPLLYPYLEWLIGENAYLRTSGVMQVQRQVDIFLDQIYVSLQAVRKQEVTETLDGNTSKLARGAYREAEIRQRVSVRGSSYGELDEPGYYEEYAESILDYEPVVTSSKKVTQKVDLSQAVRENRYSVILGDPGAGKTTLMHYLALHFATAKRDGEERVTGGQDKEDLGEVRLPIFFRIADYAERLEKQPDLSLQDYLCQFYRQWETYFANEVVESGINPKSKIVRLSAHDEVQNPKLKELLLEQMRLGHCLILLDGLDEVFDQEIRRQIVQRIDEFVDAFSSNKFVITSRIAGYRDVQLSSRFSEFTIEDMSSEQVENFLYRWCQATEQAQQPESSEEQWQRAGEVQAKEIFKAIQENDGVKRLTANPLLLTILALIHRNGERLPNQRVKLYELAVQTLTEDWQLGKKLPDATKVLLSHNEVVEFLAPLAYWMHEEKPSGVVTEAEVEQKLAEKLAELNDTEPESEWIGQAVQEFLRKVRETTGLFVERAPGVYSFMHLTFEEYFAARYIADNDISDILEIIDLRLHEPRWREPILLALGYYGVHFPRMINKLVEKLFQKLDNYQPALECGEIKIKNAAAPDAVIIWSGLPGEADNTWVKSEFPLQDLLFAGQVISEVEVNHRSIKKVIEKLVLTYVGLDADFEDDETKQLLRLLRQIELFNQKGEVIAKLKQVRESSIVSQEMRVKVQSAILYVACSEAGIELAQCVTDIVHQLEPSLFDSLRNLVAELGDEMTPVLEIMRQNLSRELEQQQALHFITGMSYIRSDNYDTAITILDNIDCKPETTISTYIAWSLATCYQKKDKFDRAVDYYQECFEQLSLCIEPSALFLFWRNLGICHRSQEKYQQSIECLQKALAITKEFNKPKEASLILYYIGKSYKEWKKYEQAINYYQKSLELYQKLDKQKDVADLCYWLGDCYRDWEKYQQAIDCELKELEIRQQLDDQTNIADVYSQLGRIYQSWGKYEDAIAHYQQSIEFYEQLDKQNNVANQWCNLADCYREWGKYQQAINCELKDLEIRQQLDDQSAIVNAYWQLGQIYKAWDKFEDAITHYQQSLKLCQQVEKQSNVAYLWYWLGDCYREWNKYQQAIDCEFKELEICKQLDDQTRVALAYYRLGRIYKEWGKYEDAIANFQQSHDCYEELDKKRDVANQLSWLGYCYGNWSKYEQAIEYYKQSRNLYQTLGLEQNIANQNNLLADCYKEWVKYEDAIAHYQQSLQLYEQLDLQNNVANQWYNLAICYREWGKYQQAIDCELKDLEIRQQLDEQKDIADAYYQLGRIYQAWGKYEDAIAYYQQSLELYQQLDKDKDVANLWYWLGDCYRELNQYEQAVECQQKCLVKRQQLNNQTSVALAYYQLGHIYQEWGKYQQALECQQQCMTIRQTLGDQSLVAVTYYQLGRIYQGWGKYEDAIAHYQQSCDLCQNLVIDGGLAWCCRQIAYSQRLLAKNTQNKTEAFNLLAQAEQNIHQAIEINTAGEYTKNLAYDHIVLSLLDSEYLRLLPTDNPSLPEKIVHFEENYHIAFTYFHQLGQTINQANKALDIARAYLEINAIENLERAEELAQTSLQVFQEYNRRKLEASTHKLLGEIYLKRAQTHQPNAETTARQFLCTSLQIYQELDLDQKAAEVEKLLLRLG